MKKVYETALQAIGFRSIISPPTLTHIMKTIYGTKITRIISIFDNIATCDCQGEIKQIHVSNIID
jgi:hypothetical protein